VISQPSEATVDRTDAPGQPQLAIIGEAVRCLKDGGVIAIPTDTVYGLAASLDHPTAIERIYTIKGRDNDKPLPVLLSAPELLDLYGTCVTSVVRQLATAFWPGPLTIVVTASSVVPSAVLRGGATVGLRVPACPITLAIIQGSGGALAATSANRSGEPEGRSGHEVRAQLGELVDLIVDVGELHGDRPSTVIDTTSDPPTILRRGELAPDVLRAIMVEAAG
jgi:L-threonylcarbamoyladenylate synthase